MPTRLFGRRGGVSVEATLIEELAPGRWRALARPPAACGRVTAWSSLPLQRRSRARTRKARCCSTSAARARPWRKTWTPTERRRCRRTFDATRCPRSGGLPDRLRRAAWAVAAPTAGLRYARAAGCAGRGGGGPDVDHATRRRRHLPAGQDGADRGSCHARRTRRDLREAADAVEACRAGGGRVVAVGDDASTDRNGGGREQAGPRWSGETALFTKPGFRFRVADLLLTNFHLPRSTLFMLVCAFAGTDRMKAAYAHALPGYRFYSYGDACLWNGPKRGDSSDVSDHRIGRRGARGVLEVAHGSVPTPAFMPVGTAATVKALTPDMIAATGAGILLANTYHLMLRPGPSALRVWVGCTRSCAGRGRSSPIQAAAR